MFLYSSVALLCLQSGKCQETCLCLAAAHTENLDSSRLMCYNTCKSVDILQSHFCETLLNILVKGHRQWTTHAKIPFRVFKSTSNFPYSCVFLVCCNCSVCVCSVSLVKVKYELGPSKKNLILHMLMKPIFLKCYFLFFSNHILSKDDSNGKNRQRSPH